MPKETSLRYNHYQPPFETIRCECATVVLTYEDCLLIANSLYDLSREAEKASKLKDTMPLGGYPVKEMEPDQQRVHDTMINLMLSFEQTHREERKGMHHDLDH